MQPNPDPESRARERRRFVRAAAVLATIVGVCWFIAHSWWQDTPPEPQRSAGPWADGVANAWPSRPESETPTALPRLPAPKDDEFELCGYGRVRSTGFELPLPVQSAANTTILRWADQQVASNSEVERARGLLLRARYGAAVAQEVFARKIARETNDPLACYTNDTCREQVRTLGEKSAQSDREALARLASATSDPTVYGLAMIECGSDVRRYDRGSCSLLSPDQWVRLDPGNGVPWMFIAAEAAARKDASSRDEALMRVAAAQSLDMRWQPILDAIVELGELAPNDTERTVIQTSTVGVWAALPIPAYLPVMQACSPETIRDPARRELCGQLAQVLTERDTNVIGLALGARIAERVGWPAERIARLRDEVDAIQAFQQQISFKHPIYGCAWSEELRKYSIQRARIGEVAMGRAQIRESGRTAAEWAAQWRAQRERERQRATADDAAKSAAPPTPHPPK